MTAATPPRSIRLLITTTLVTVWGVLRLVVFDSVLFPLTYALPLLSGIWLRDKALLWGMAAAFVVLQTIKQVRVLAPIGGAPGGWAAYGAVLVNVVAAAAIVHRIIVLRDRLDEAMRRMEAANDVIRGQNERLEAQAVELARQNDKLASQAELLAAHNEELASQAEELAAQNEELTAQAEELAEQNEELQTQTEEIQVLGSELARREQLLQTLLDSARLARDEQAVLADLCRAARTMFEGTATAVVVYEKEHDRLEARAIAGTAPCAQADASWPAERSFANLVIGQNRTACLDDTSLRPDLVILQLEGHPPFKAVLCAPMRASGQAFGAVAVYSVDRQQWTAEQFRLADWLAGQSARVLEILRAKEALQAAGRRKSEFLATLSHELRNALAPIRYALRLLNGAAGPVPVPGPREAIERQLAYLVRLVDDLLDMTRIASGKIRLRKEHVELAALVRHAVEAVEPDVADAKHELVIRLPPERVWLDADVARLTQALTNLLNNAVRYTPEGGRIALTAQAGPGEICLSVADNGVGLAPDDLDRIFDLFTQVGDPGTGGLGIGLALVRGIVEQHGGRVEARSAGRDRGAEFLLYLPRAGVPRAEGTGAGVAAARAFTSDGTRRILVVDDNTDAADLLRSLLEMQGHEVRVAYDGASALTCAREFRPDLGLLDIGLPGMNGYELARQLRADPLTATMRLVAVTGWGQDEDRRRAHEAGFDAYVTKPADPDLIQQLVASTRRQQA